jgi:hypothetical protein
MDAKIILATAIPAAIIVIVFFPLENILGSHNAVSQNGPSEYCIVESTFSPGGNSHIYQLCILNSHADPDNLSKGNAKGNAHSRI